jgi:single-stranded-DNA-specific exonuclease
MNRGFNEIDTIKSLLNCSLKSTIPDPSSFLGMDLAVERVSKAILDRENIMVFGDYDVDGITSTFLVVRYLKLLGVTAEFHIPNRFSEGYGINSESIRLAKEKQTTIFIAVDSGTNAVAEIEDAQQYGIDVVVLDHHVQTASPLPRAVAIVNPNRLDQAEIGNSHIKHLCAVGIIFIFLMALRRYLKNIGFLDDTNSPDILQLIDIVALGTLCDVVELRGINRAIVKCFLKRGVRSIGIKALMRAFGIKSIESPEDLSFFIGPAINAAGRIGNPTIALQLLLEEDEDEAYEMAKKLMNLNETRKAIEKEMIAEAEAVILAMNLESNKGICVYGRGWHEGVIGIVAGRIKEKYYKPAFAISFDSEGNGKGSARSVPGFHIGNFFEIAKRAGVITDGGGHALAGGFSINYSKISALQECLNNNIEYDFIKRLRIDCEVKCGSRLYSFADELKNLEPFGNGLEKPLVCLKGVRVRHMVKTKNGNHLMITFSSLLRGHNVRGIIFNVSAKTNLLRMLEQHKMESLNVVGYIGSNRKFGMSFIVEDAAISLPEN